MADFLELSPSTQDTECFKNENLTTTEFLNDN